MARPTISAVLLARKNSSGTPQNSLNKQKREEVVGCPT
jgi:hypothetical protein